MALITTVHAATLSTRPQHDGADHLGLQVERVGAARAEADRDAFGGMKAKNRLGRRNVDYGGGSSWEAGGGQEYGGGGGQEHAGGYEQQQAFRPGSAGLAAADAAVRGEEAGAGAAAAAALAAREAEVAALQVGMDCPRHTMARITSDCG